MQEQTREVVGLVIDIWCDFYGCPRDNQQDRWWYFHLNSKEPGVASRLCESIKVEARKLQLLIHCF